MTGRRSRAGPTRREFLRAGSGAAAGMALGCSRGLPSAADDALDTGRITGSIVGASHRAGHRLRRPSQGAPPRWPEPRQTRDVPVVIVGGGIAGLSAAWKLARSGFRDFTVLELEPEPGGNARWGANDVSAYPWGAHYLPVPAPEATAVRELVEEMGLVEGYGPDGAPRYDPRHLCHAPQERRFVDGRWRAGLSARDVLDPDGDGSGATAELAAFERQVAAFRDYRDAQGRRAFALPVALGTTDPEIVALDRLSMAEYFERAGWASPDLRWYVDYCCRDDYGCTIDTTSAWAGWHYFCSRPDDVEYLTWPEGNGRIVRHYLNSIGDRVRTGMLVWRVRTNGTPDIEGPTGGGGQGVGRAPGVGRPPGVGGPPGIGGTGRTSARTTPDDGVEIDVLETRTETAVRFRARHCIYALPRFTAPRVIEGYAPAGLDAFTYSPWMVSNLTVRRLPDGAAWDNVIADSPSLGYVVATHQDLRIAPGRSVLTYYLPLTAPNPAAARVWMLERQWRDWVSLILADLGQAHPDIESLVTRVDVMLWGHAMIRPVPGFVWGEARLGAAARHGAVRFAHSDMGGISVFEEAQYHGVRAAEEVMRELGHPFASSL